MAAPGLALPDEGLGAAFGLLTLVWLVGAAPAGLDILAMIAPAPAWRLLARIGELLALLAGLGAMTPEHRRWIRALRSAS